MRGPDRSLLPTGDEPVDVALTRDEGCVLGRAGHLACWGGSGAKAWDGLYGAVAAGAGRFCAITATGDVRCDRGWPR